MIDPGWRETGPVTAHHATSAFAGFRFPREVISVAVRWYLRYGLSYRDVEELLAERGVTVDHVTVYETYVKVVGHWAYLYRAVDQYGQVIDVLLSVRRDLAAARRFFSRALRAGTVPAEVTTDRAPAYPRVLDELVPSALHTVEQYAKNPIEADHGRLKARLRPMRGLKRHRPRGHLCPCVHAASRTGPDPTSHQRDQGGWPRSPAPSSSGPAGERTSRRSRTTARLTRASPPSPIQQDHH